MALRSAEVGAMLKGVRDPQAYADAQWDLKLVFGGCFGGTRIEATDGDGWVERKGAVLVFEFKGSGLDVELGQDLLYRSLVRHRGIFVMAVRGRRHEPEEYCFWRTTGVGQWVACDLEALRRRVADWYRWADGLDGKPACGCLRPGQPGYLEALPDWQGFEQKDGPPSLTQGPPPTSADGTVLCEQHRGAL